MARFVSLILPGSLIAVGLAATGCFSTLRAEPPVPAQTHSQTTATVPVKTPFPAKTPAAGPAASPDTLGPYGKIVVPGTEAAYPVKLKLPFPGAGEVKVPSPDELAMREKLESLAVLSDQEIHMQLEQWPAYGKMTLRDQGLMLQRIQDFRDYRTRMAMQAAHDLGLLTLTPEQKTRFEKDYWDKRLKMDEDLARQFGGIFKAREQKMDDELSREFATGMGPIVQGPKPPVVPPLVPVNKPAAPVASSPGGAPVAQSPR